MHLWSDSFSDGDQIPAEHAFGIPDEKSHVAFGANRNPHLEWSDVPEGTLSFALICHDRDVPTKPDDVNQEGREVPADLPRADFFHWVLVDLPGGVRSIAEGEFGEGVTPHGRDARTGPRDTRQGRNDYTGWFSGDAAMEGDFFGYDGPCPPWNDSIVHHYVFTLFSLAVDRLELEDGFEGGNVREAAADNVLAEATLTGTYSLNPRLAP